LIVVAGYLTTTATAAYVGAVCLWVSPERWAKQVEDSPFELLEWKPNACVEDDDGGMKR
ncbi:hypothetical protein ACLOJK_036606, partial [Asimina triloba]